LTGFPEKRKLRIIVGISGGSGIIYGIRLLEVLRQLGIESHLVITPAAKITLAAETDWEVSKVEKLATVSYRINDIAAEISSGSYPVDAMVIIPCSMHTMGAIASGVSDNLLTRSAEVTLKERRPLVLVPRETPLTIIHIENMAKLAHAGAIIAPAMPAFYHRPKSIDDIVDHMVGKVLDLLKIENNLFKRWTGASSFLVQDSDQ
jgi:4-hydroxy-3-polyprenylbenzoate decarboxylase